MAVRFEVDIERASARIVAGLLEGQHFGMFDAVVRVEAGPCDVSSGIHDDGTDVRAG